VVVCSPHFADSIVEQFNRLGVESGIIGAIHDGQTGVEIVG
jgi:hypothetical protein